MIDEKVSIEKDKKKDWKIKSPLLLNVLGIIFALVLWQICSSLQILGQDFGAAFSPISTFSALYRLAISGELIRQILPSLKRIIVGLSIATNIGFLVGLIIGTNKSMEHFTYIPFQFIRMISPLAWMPIAIILLGIGDKPIFFLIIIAAVWPIIMDTHAGVRRVNQSWVEVVKTLGGSDKAVLWKVIIPSVIPHVLTGLKLALGISWIILVPAEMLGVSSGLGYYILDCRDRFSYDEMLAVILVIGLIGLIFDYLISSISKRFTWDDSKS